MVTVAGSRITSDTYIVWTDTEILFRIPPNVGSGMVRVVNEKGRSNGVLFSNREHIPVILSGPLKPGRPYIESITPLQGAVGTLVTIRGLNFGFDRGESHAFFSQQDLSEQSRFEKSQPDKLACSLVNYDYESWNNQEIKIYVPDGATSGGLSVTTDRGDSNSLFFEVKDGPGTKLFTSRRGYQIVYEVEIYASRGPSEASLDLWIPRLFQGLEQRDLEWTPEPAPLWDDYYGTMRYHFDRLPELGSQRIIQNYWFERYTVETEIIPSRVNSQYNTDRELYKVYTGSDSLITLTEEFRRLAEELVGRQTNPYRKARILYDYLLEELEYSDSAADRSPAAALESGEADAYNYALLFCLLARGVGIPSRPVAGYIVHNNRLTVRHYWGEYYLEDFGWIPVDLVLGDGVQFGNFPPFGGESPGEYYFGSLDNQHLTFSRGVAPIKALLPQGKTKSLSRMYGLQNFHEEASLLESYETLWKDVRIVQWW